MSKYEVCSSRNQKIKKSKFTLKSQNFQDLEIFLSVGKITFFNNFVPIFHHDER